ncbi:MAG TPA: adenylate kinase [Candidatus Dormibacteraeota bacterium]|nr:adenylate kinase [Candidatus Dormibacteraeota bacterium]
MGEATRRNVALFGPAGSGKGTQAEFLTRELGIEHIATGEMLREELARGTELGQTLAAYLDVGKLVPDEVIVAMIRHRLSEAQADGGFVLDGFPRTLAQARSLLELLVGLQRPLDIAVVLDVPSDQLVVRLSRRAALEKRADDTPAVIAERLRIYHDETEPVLEFLAQTVPMVRLDGSRPVAEVSQTLLKAIV